MVSTTTARDRTEKPGITLPRLPLIVQIIHCIFGKEYIPDSFESINREKIEKAEKKISRQCFHEVIPRFQNILEGTRTSSHHVFYEYDENQINLKPHAMRYFKQNYPLLLKSVILEWARFLEKINPWSYIYEDEIWNLVLSCRECNLRKHSSLAQEEYIQHLLKRDLEYFDKIDLLKKSLLKLDPQNHYESAIRKHYRSCVDYGFTVVNM